MEDGNGPERFEEVEQEEFEENLFGFLLENSGQRFSVQSE
jgi:hypothetical protein